VIVPFTAGAAIDITGRVICVNLSQFCGQPVTIDIRGEGIVIPASEVAARRKPNAYTLLLISVMTLAVNPPICLKLAYRLLEVFEPISLLGTLSFSSWFVQTRH